ncbi:transcription factor bHLH68-like isoform X2 [Phragmites australis]|uniref:transcription factor bHLH68-like isoform X2 n=1 Tax=Phragmites australis TaxID=29695 RepID=UPI002D7697DD|nr:transcription factor bHLH68-like isoform X2 [Phragmites australis]
MDRGLVHKSSPLVGEIMGEAGHGCWSVNNLRAPLEEQHHPSPFMPSNTTALSSSPLHSFSSLLLSNHYPLPTTNTSPWHDSSSSSQGLGQQDSWSQLIHGGLANGEDRYKEGQMLFPTTICSEAGGSGNYIYNTTASRGSSTSDEIQLPWGSVHQHHKALQQKASSPRSSSITPTTSLGSNMLEFSNNSSSPRECISTASGSAFKKARTQEPSPAQSTVKVMRKEKLGDRITALHQLVSPFGKTDTASVLLEAIGYIRFLHGQIEALSSPYVGGSNGGGGGCASASSSSSSKQQQHEASVQGERHNIFPEDSGQLLHDSAMKKRGQPDQDGSYEEAKKDLRSKGLCLVPVSCTLDVGLDAVAGPADYWAAAPAFGMGFGR